MMLNLMKAVDDNATAAELTGEENDGLLSIKGSLDGGDYVLTVDENGILSTFEMPNNKLKMRFTELKTAEIALEQDTQASTEELSAGTAETLAIQ